MFTKQHESKNSRMKGIGRAEALESKNTLTQLFSELCSVSRGDVIVYCQAFRKQCLSDEYNQDSQDWILFFFFFLLVCD